MRPTISVDNSLRYLLCKCVGHLEQATCPFERLLIVLGVVADYCERLCWVAIQIFDCSNYVHEYVMSVGSNTFRDFVLFVYSFPYYWVWQTLCFNWSRSSHTIGCLSFQIAHQHMIVHTHPSIHTYRIAITINSNFGTRGGTDKIIQMATHANTLSNLTNDSNNRDAYSNPHKHRSRVLYEISNDVHIKFHIRNNAYSDAAIASTTVDRAHLNLWSARWCAHIQRMSSAFRIRRLWVGRMTSRTRDNPSTDHHMSNIVAAIKVRSNHLHVVICDKRSPQFEVLVIKVVPTGSRLCYRIFVLVNDRIVVCVCFLRFMDVGFTRLLTDQTRI